MEIVDIYNTYKELNKEYVEYMENILKIDFEDLNLKEINEKVKEFSKKFEDLKEKSNEIENVDDNLKDLQYLLVDGIFVCYDLMNFCNYDAKERLKMRMSNYINKGRRIENGIL